MDIGSQRRISQSRAPRVQIVYDVEVSGEAKSVELPFVMGVMGDFSGHDAENLPPGSERRFKEVDAHNLDRFMREVSPTLDLRVPNELNGIGSMDARLKFQKMDDFNPDEVARQVPALAKLMEAREKLSTLLAYIDGKAGAEELLGRILKDQPLLEAISQSASQVNGDSANPAISSQP